MRVQEPEGWRFPAAQDLANSGARQRQIKDGRTYRPPNCFKQVLTTA